MYGERDSAHELAKASLGLSERKMRPGRTWLLEDAPTDPADNSVICVEGTGALPPANGTAGSAMRPTLHSEARMLSGAVPD